MLGRALHHLVAVLIRRTWPLAVVTIAVCAVFAAHTVNSLLDAEVPEPAPPPVVAPQPVRNSEFAEELGRVMHRPAALPVPAFALEFALGEMARALLLASQRVVPQRLQQIGFQFSDPQLAPAIAAALAH